MAYVKSLRDITIRSLSGHIVTIEANKPCQIPNIILDEAFAVGCVQCDEEGKLVLSGVADPRSATDADQVDDIPKLTPDEARDTAKRQQVIKMAVKKLYTINKKEDFKLDNTPKCVAVERYTGFTVAALEILEAMEALETAQ